MSLLLNVLVGIHLLLYVQVFSKQYEPSKHDDLPIFRFYSNEEKTKKLKSRATATQPDIENYDVMCHLQAKIGHGLRGEEKRYFYYDIMTDRCISFAFAGPDGNNNKFERLADCESLCKGSFTNTMMSLRSDATEVCSMQHDPGNCIAYITRYYYDVNRKDCYEFLYSGCGGNKNRFHSKSACRARCRYSGS